MNVYRYEHLDGRGLMNNGSLDYDKLSDDEMEEVEDGYLGLQQPPSEYHSSPVEFAFTKEGVERHERLIDLLTKASKTGVEVREFEVDPEKVLWESGDGQVGILRSVF